MKILDYKDIDEELLNGESINFDLDEINKYEIIVEIEDNFGSDYIFIMDGSYILSDRNCGINVKLNKENVDIILKIN